jgi:hypothetical protein
MGGTRKAVAPPPSQVLAQKAAAEAKAKASDPFAFANDAFG